MIINSYEFRVERKTSNKSIWCCIFKDRQKCKARCATYGNTLELKSTSHNHEYTFRGHYEHLTSQILNIQHGKIDRH